MIRPILTLSALCLFAALPAQAGLFEITPDMQACTNTADCTVVPDSCTKACATVPVNTASAEKLAAQRLQSCGESVNTLPTCATYPPMEGRCVNNRCTIGFAFDNNSDDMDYQKGKASGKSSRKKSAAASAHADGAYKDGSGFLELPAGYDGPGVDEAKPAAMAAPEPAPSPVEEPSVPEIAEEPAPAVDMAPADDVTAPADPMPVIDPAPKPEASAAPPAEAETAPAQDAASPAQLAPSENFEEVEIEDDEPQMAPEGQPQSLPAP